MRAALVAVACACTPPPAAPAIANPGAGIAIALYDAGPGSAPYAVIDDRRWVEVTGGALELSRIDPGASLASLVIEPLAGGALAVGACSRERIPRDPGVRRAASAPDPERYLPELRCAVTAAPGRHLVRVLYVSTTLGYRAEHAIAVDRADRASVTSRFAIGTPAWHERADVTVFDGIPGGARAPRELARGPVELDGSTAVIAAAPRDAAARLRRVYAGAIHPTGVAATDPQWGRDSVPEVWLWLELDGIELVPGVVHAHLALPGEPARDISVAHLERDRGHTRVPLWIDPELRGTRQRSSDLAEAAGSSEHFVITVVNTGSSPREVWVEEQLRPRRCTIEHASPPLAVIGDLARVRLAIAPLAIAHVTFTASYE